MSFTSELANKQFQLNVVIKLDSEFYSIFQVDSDSTDIIGTGSGIKSDQVGLVFRPRISPISVDIRDVNTTIQTITFSLLDKDEKITAALSNSITQLLDTQAIMYAGFITGSFDFSDYKILGKSRVKRILKRENAYDFQTSELSVLLDKPIFNTFSTLDGAISAVDTTITLNDVTDFPDSGRGKIEDEFIQWTGRDTGNDQLTGVSRGDLSSTADAHDDEEEIFLVTEIQDNPIDILLDILKSPDNGTLDDGLNIDPTLIDETTFTTIRDSFFSGEEFQFFLFDIGDGLDFIQDELLKATNTRIVPKDGLISLAILDQVDFSASPDVINEDSISKLPVWQINSDKIVNRLIIEWNFSEAEDKFSRTTVFEDSDSITNFGLKKELKFQFKGIRASLNGSAIVQNRGNRLIERLKNPLTEIKVQTHFNQSEANIGDDFIIEHRYIPAQGGSLGIADQLELMSKSIDFTRAQVDFTFQYPSFSGLRIGLIAPSPVIASVTDQKTFDVPSGEGECYRAGDFLKLWDDSTMSFFPDAANEIASVSGDTITMVNDFTTTLTTSVRIKIPDYDQASAFQKGRYAFIVPNTGTFVSDGFKGYEILP